MVKAIVRISALNDDLRPVLEELHGRLDEYPGQARKQAEHPHHVTQRLGELRGSKPP
jgi:hypothetical protein